METGTRGELLEHLADLAGSVTPPHPLRIGVDGRPASGKTTLADELAAALRERGREVIRASIESFQFPREKRWRRGEYSPISCYEDSFDFASMHRFLLDPLGPGGDLKYRPAIYDLFTDTPLSIPFATAPADAVLIFEGVFTLRPELVHKWDLRILVNTPFERTLERARVRDLPVYGSLEAVERRFNERYGPSQERYYATVRPAELADVVVENEQPARPRWTTRAR